MAINALSGRVVVSISGRVYHAHPCERCGGDGGLSGRLEDGSYENCCEDCLGDGEFRDEDCTCAECVGERAAIADEEAEGWVCSHCDTESHRKADRKHVGCAGWFISHTQKAEQQQMERRRRASAELFAKASILGEG